MEKKLFAIKIPALEKEAMDYTAAVTGQTLTSLYYKGVQNTLHEMLGAVLLQQVDPRAEIVKPMLDGDVGWKHIPPMITEFMELMDSGQKEEFRKIFYNVKTVEKENLFQEFNIYELTGYMGKKYLEVSKNFVQVSIPIVEDLLFEHMLYLYYKMSVVGSMRMLEQEWASNHLKINAFKKALIKEYHRTYGELVAPVQVEYDAGGDR